MLLHSSHSTAAIRTPLLATVTTVCGWCALGSAIVVTLLHFQSHKGTTQFVKTYQCLDDVTLNNMQHILVQQYQQYLSCVHPGTIPPPLSPSVHCVYSVH